VVENAPLVRLAAIKDTPLSVDEVLSAVSDPAAGGRAVRSLTYSAHPAAGDQLVAVAETVGRAHGVRAVAATHRVGDLAVGDLAVVVAVASEHRQEALAGCRELIDTLKSTVPIWKHQRFTDDTEEWVGSP
jgi:molybdopterin synthase catalytic subunit